MALIISHHGFRGASISEGAGKIVGEDAGAAAQEDAFRPRADEVEQPQREAHPALLPASLWRPRQAHEDRLHADVHRGLSLLHFFHASFSALPLHSIPSLSRLSTCPSSAINATILPSPAFPYIRLALRHLPNPIPVVPGSRECNPSLAWSTYHPVPSERR